MVVVLVCVLCGRMTTPQPRLSKMADESNRSPPQARSLRLGAHISCTITHGDILRGNVIATDETNEAVVISILINTHHDSLILRSEVARFQLVPKDAHIQDTPLTSGSS